MKISALFASALSVDSFMDKFTNYDYKLFAMCFFYTMKNGTRWFKNKDKMIKRNLSLIQQ